MSKRYITTGKTDITSSNQMSAINQRVADYYTAKTMKQRRTMEIIAVLSRFDERGKYNG